MLYILKSAFRAAEQGLIPDRLMRRGIRRMLRQRLREIEAGGCEAAGRRFRSFIEDAHRGPVALVPERANEQHYEVSAEFFAQILGPRLKYSCGHWPDGVHTLAAAENAALRETAQRADIQNGLRILDLGCGWGSLSLWAAERFPDSRFTAVSNSALQRQFIEAAALRRGLTNLRVVTADINDFTPPRRFDRIVSIEMFEHVRNHAELLRRISCWLRPAGKLFVHTFCHRQHTYPFTTNGHADWMAQHFFTGGVMPGEDLLLRCQQDLVLADHWRWNGRHYQRTCDAWLENLDQRRDRIEQIFAESTGGQGGALRARVNRWRMFLMACSELFGYRDGNEWWVAHYLFEPRRTGGVAPTSREGVP